MHNVNVTRLFVAPIVTPLTPSQDDSLLTTPVKMTPSKHYHLPLSPFHILGYGSPQLNFEGLISTPHFSPFPPVSQSTPVQAHLSIPPHFLLSSRTPKSRRALLQVMPKTPTPLKNALREIEKKSGALKHLVSGGILCSVVSCVECYPV